MNYSKRNIILLTAALGNALVSINATLINNGLSAISNDLKVELTTSQWIVTSYLLAMAAILPVSGYMTARFGPQRFFLLSISIFTFSSLLCGLSEDAGFLVLFRFMQGIGGGGLLAVSQTIALTPFEPHERAAATTTLNLPGLAAPVFGPLLGGWLTDNFNWPSLFFINVAVGLVALLLTLKFIPDERYQNNLGIRLDVIGLVFTLLGIVLVIYAFAVVNQVNPASRTVANPSGAVYGWSYWQFWACAGSGILILTGVIIYELFFTTYPLVDLRLYKDHNFRVSSFLIWSIIVLIHATFILLPIYFQRVHQPIFSATESGMLMVSQGVGMLLGMITGNKLYNRFGSRLPVGLGLLLTGLGMWQSGRLQPDSEGSSILPWLFSTGLGLGLATLPVTTQALQHLNGVALANGTSLFIATRQIFGSLGTAVVTSLLVLFSSSFIAQTTSQNAPGVALTSRQLQELNALAGTSANNTVFTLLAFGCLLSLPLVFMLPVPFKPDKGNLLEKEMEVLS
ncbi:MAG: drug resistance transporter, EmrB/QacA subfamily [Chloroflexi bacterium]|jgi:EmrB/QacA subfamily drug resistance transporter|nr:drug resistance transporter, EmrB/QacA subfamily [Chloroflexota bacterium]